MKLLYFAWVKQKAGVGAEDITLPEGVGTISDLITWLTTRGENFAEAFEHQDAIRAAVNQEHKNFDAPISDDDEIAFFPPVTGG